LDALLKCAQHFALGDQELSSSVAFHAASATDLYPFLVVYEDVTTNGSLVQKGIVDFLGLDIAINNIFEENAQNDKEHSQFICNYSDVNCNDLMMGLSKDYPCLWRQLRQVEEGFTWTVPMLQDGTISIRGDCKPLKPLGEEHYVRSFHELYQLPYE